MSVTPVVVALLLAGALFGTSVVAAWRRREAPAASAFAFATGVAGLGALVVAGSVWLELAPAVVIAPTLIVALVLPVPWLRFSLEYTGRSDLATPQFTAVASIIPALGVVATAVIFGSRLVPGLTLPAQGSASGLAALTVTFLGLLQWLGLLYAGGLMFVSSGLVLLTFQRYRYLDSTAGLLLGVFGTIPWISLLFGFQVVGIDPQALAWTVAAGFLTGGAAAGLAVGRYRLFRGTPAISNIGPTTVIEELDDAMFVTDDTGTVVEVNPAAERAVGAASTAIVGASIESQLDVTIDGLPYVEYLELDTEVGRRLFEPTLSELSDQHGYRLGYAVLLRDVTVRTTHRQRVEVLNRVLNHNLRNSMSVILGHLEFLRDGVDRDELHRSLDKIARSSYQLIGLSERSREIEAALEVDSTVTERTPLTVVVDEVFEDVATRHTEGAYVSEVPDDVVLDGPGELLRLALRHLVENAVEHNPDPEPTVEVRAAFGPGDYPLRISVLDDGPGIPDSETSVIERGTETDLEHASSLGLWVVRWAVTRLGGEVSFDEREPRGTAVTLHLPGAYRATGAGSPAAEDSPAA